MTKMDILSRTVPDITTSSHKGSSGRIGILGGSTRYTGAPYYSAMSSLRTGAELAFVFCAEEAAIPIKCYSPELIVTGVYTASRFDYFANAMSNHRGNDERPDVRLNLENEANGLVNEMVQEVICFMNRIHALVIGPGLGRCPLVMKATAKIIKESMQRGLNIVLDADALHLLTMEEYSTFPFFDSPSAKQSTIVITPNLVEYKHLVKYLGDGSEDELKRKLSQIVLVKKGHYDIVELMSSEYKIECREEGGLKRSGGLGDVLSGIVGLFVAWNKILPCSTREDIIIGCWLACCVTKVATRKAFKKKKRSMTASDVLEEIGAAFESIMEFNDKDTHSVPY